MYFFNINNYVGPIQVHLTRVTSGYQIGAVQSVSNCVKAKNNYTDEVNKVVIPKKDISTVYTINAFISSYCIISFIENLLISKVSFNFKVLFH